MLARIASVRFLALGAAIVLLLAFVGGAMLTVRRGSDIGDRLAIVGSAFDIDSLIRGSPDLEFRYRELELLREEMDRFILIVSPVIVVSRGLGTLPWIGDSLGSVATLVDRASVDLDSASVILASMEELRNGYLASTLINDSGPEFTLNNQAFAVRARRLARDLTEAKERVNANRPNDSRKPPFLSVEQWQRFDALESRLDAALDIGPAVAELLATSADIRVIVHSFLAPEAENSIDLLTLSRELGRLQGRIDAVQSGLSSRPQMIDQFERLDQTLAAVALVSEGARSAARSLASVIDALDAGESGIVGNGAGLVAAFDMVEREETNLTRSYKLLEKGNRMISDQSREPGSLFAFFEPSFSKMLDLSARLKAGINIIQGFAPLAPSLLGLDAPRTFLILGHSADELRATGGFVSGLWLVTVDQGDLIETSYLDVVQADDVSKYSEYPPPPIPLELHMDAGVWLLRDVSWEPDFPLVADAARLMLEIGQQREVDGVIGINQWTYQIILSALDGILVPGHAAPVNAENLIESLEVGTDLFGRAYMDDVFNAFVNRLMLPMNQSEMLRLAGALDSVLRQRQLLINVANPSDQALVSRLGWAGEVSSTTSDYLLISDANVGWSKVDRLIERQTSYRIHLALDGPSRASLTLSYDNPSGAGARSCERQWMPEQLGLSYERLKEACYWNYVRAYVSPRARLVDATAQLFPAGSVAVISGARETGAPSLDLTSEYGKNVFGSLLVVPPGQSREVTFLYDLGNAVIHEDDDQFRYQLLMQTQGGTRGRNINVEIMPPAGYEIESFSAPEHARLGNGKIWYTFDLRQDILIELELTRIE